MLGVRYRLDASLGASIGRGDLTPAGQPAPELEAASPGMSPPPSPLLKIPALPSLGSGTCYGKLRCNATGTAMRLAELKRKPSAASRASASPRTADP